MLLRPLAAAARLSSHSADPRWPPSAASTSACARHLCRRTRSSRPPPRRTRRLSARRLRSCALRARTLQGHLVAGVSIAAPRRHRIRSHCSPSAVAAEALLEAGALFAFIAMAVPSQSQCVDSADEARGCTVPPGCSRARSVLGRGDGTRRRVDLLNRCTTARADACVLAGPHRLQRHVQAADLPGPPRSWRAGDCSLSPQLTQNFCTYASRVMRSANGSSVADIKGRLALGYAQLGLLQARAGRADEAEASFAESEELLPACHQDRQM
jgi:hypothetical protein